MQKRIKLRMVGASVGLTMPVGYLRAHGFWVGDEVLFTETDYGAILEFIRVTRTPTSMEQRQKASNVETEAVPWQAPPEGTETKADVVEAEAAVDTT